MHLRNRVLDGAQNVAIEKAVEIARQSALDADLGGAAVPGFSRFLYKMFGGMRIGVGGSGAARETAEATADEADIGEIDVAVDDVSDCVADGFVAQRACGS